MRILFLSIFIFNFWNYAHANKDTLVIGVMDSPPFFWKENGQSTGFHFEISKALTEKLKLKMKIKEAPILRIIKMLKKGEVDVVLATDHKELESINAKKEHVLELDSFLYTLADQPITSKKDIKGIVARLSNSCSALQNHPGIEWMDAESYEQAYGLLKFKRIQAVCGTIAFQIVANKKQSSDAIKINSFVLSKRALWIQARPDYDPKRWAEIQRSIAELIDSGVIANQAKKFSK